MSTDELIKIVIAAIVATLTKDLIGWLWSIVKKLPVKFTINATVKRLANISLIFLLIDISLLLYGYLTLLSLIRSSEPVTHGSVFMILFWSWICIAMLREVRSDIDWYAKRIKMTKNV